MGERRSTNRWHSVLTARITSNRRSEVIECTVRDLSDTGARIYFSDATQLPSEFKIEIPSKRLQVESRLIWSQGANHGVMFLEEVKAWTDPVRAAAA